MEFEDAENFIAEAHREGMLKFGKCTTYLSQKGNRMVRRCCKPKRETPTSPKILPFQVLTHCFEKALTCWWLVVCVVVT